MAFLLAIARRIAVSVSLLISIGVTTVCLDGLIEIPLKLPPQSAGFNGMRGYAMDKKMPLVLCHRDKNERHWDALECRFDGPGRIRTYDQGIHSAPAFPPGVDYLFTRAPSPCVWVRDAPSLLSRALEPSGSLCTFRRCTGGSAQDCHGITSRRFP